MSTTRTMMVAGACAAVVGASSAEAKAELHRFAFRGHVGDIPAPLVGSPLWTGISPGDPMLISCVLDAPDDAITFDQLDTARLISVSLVIGGRLETTDGVGSTIRAILEEGIARAGVAGAHNGVEFDLVLPSGVRVLVHVPTIGSSAVWAIGETSGQIRLATRDTRDREYAPIDPAAVDPAMGRSIRAAYIEDSPINAPSPSGVALFAPALVLVARRRRALT